MMTASTIIDGEMRTSVKSLRSGCPWVSKIYRSPSSTYYDGRAAINGLSGGLETRIDGFVERLEEGRPISFADITADTPPATTKSKSVIPRKPKSARRYGSTKSKEA